MSAVKYTTLTVETLPRERSSPLPSPPSSPSTSSSFSWLFCGRHPTRFQCIVAQIFFVTLLTLAIFGFRCLTYVTPSPCIDYSKLPYFSANSTAAVTAKPALKRLPDAIIIGVRKCGTRALLSFLNRHPLVRAAGKEIHFFDNYYDLGTDWYRDQMPPARDLEVVIEKTPGYFIEPEAPERVMKTLGPGVKLILIVRDPVERTVSDYVQLKLKYEKTRRLRNSKNFHEDENSAPPTMAPFERKVLLNDGRQINTSYKPIRIGQYDVHMNRWLNVFSMEQILVVDGERMVKNPFDSLLKVETFLGLEHWFSPDMFVRNPDTGFFCLKASETGVKGQGCLAKSKGRPHPRISDSVRRKLTNFYRKHVYNFFSMIGQQFNDWPTIT